jgi:hypothetical protein
MRSLPTSLLIVAVALVVVADVSSALAQSSRSAAGVTFAQAERNSIELKQGMSVDEVERLLGKPRRTTLKNNGSSMNAASPGALQWTYTWTSNSSPATLQVEFAAKSPESWYVNSWEWVRY